MNRIAIMLLVLFACAFGISTATASDRQLPEDSLFRMEAAFTDQAGTGFRLIERRGRPQLVAMFYTSCRFVCPLIVDSAKGIEHALSSEERDRLDILLVSLDPARDDTAALRTVFDQRKLDAGHWTLARTDAGHVRTLAALLGVRYRPLADGEFNHTSMLVLLDAEGRRISSTSKLGSLPDPVFVAAVRATLCEDEACAPAVDTSAAASDE